MFIYLMPSKIQTHLTSLKNTGPAPCHANNRGEKALTDARQISLIVIGAGNVGRAFLSQVLHTRAALAERYCVDLQPVAIADSTGAHLNADGLSPTALESALAAKAGGTALAAQTGALSDLSPADLVRQAANQGVEHAIVVDTTAAEGMETALHLALDYGYGVVLANKRPLAGEWRIAKRFFDHPRVRFEATVGAGLPIVTTLQYLIDTGDTIHRIEGALSGTLGYLCTGLEDGESFSTIVTSAKEKGYTEPDPREDLSGMDVARKALILGRMAGWQLTQDKLEVDPLYPAEMAELSVSEFMHSLPHLDVEFAMYMGAAGGVPRYMAEVLPSGGRVSLRMLDAHQAAFLRGTLNRVSIWTERYAEVPLSLSGPGAGMEITAAAVLQDCLQLAQNIPCG